MWSKDLGLPLLIAVVIHVVFILGFYIIGAQNGRVSHNTLYNIRDIETKIQLVNNETFNANRRKQETEEEKQNPQEEGQRNEESISRSVSSELNQETPNERRKEQNDRVNFVNQEEIESGGLSDEREITEASSESGKENQEMDENSEQHRARVENEEQIQRSSREEGTPHE